VAVAAFQGTLGFFVSTYEGEPADSIVQLTGSGFASTDDGGCGCHVLRPQHAAGNAVLGLLGTLFFLRRRRRSAHLLDP
jgi:MYXO-CTERM domain-containing protein